MPLVVVGVAFLQPVAEGLSGHPSAAVIDVGLGLGWGVAALDCLAAELPLGVVVAVLGHDVVL